VRNAVCEILELFDDAVEGGASGEDQQGRLRLRRVRVGVTSAVMVEAMV